MFRNAQQGIQKILAAAVVITLAMPSNLFAARPTASRNTPAVTGKMERDFSMRAEIRSIDDVRNEVNTVMKQLGQTPIREVLKPHLATNELLTPDLEESSASIIEAAYDRVWTGVSRKLRPSVDKVFGLAMVLYSGQPMSPTDPRPYLVKPAGEILTLFDELAILGQTEGQILKAVSLALLRKSIHDPLNTTVGKKLYALSSDETAVKEQIAVLTRTFSSEELPELILSASKPKNFNPGDLGSAKSYYEKVTKNDPLVQLTVLAEIAQDLRDQELYASTPQARQGITPVLLKPIWDLLSDSNVDLSAKRGFLGILWRALTAQQSGIKSGRYTKPYIVFSPDDEEKFPAFEQRYKGAVPVAAPPVKEWADKMAKNDHVLSIDLPSLADLNDGLLDQLIRDGLIYSATTNNNGNLKYLKELQARALGKYPNPVLAEAVRIARKNPAISRKDAVAQAYENLINNFVARLAVKLHPIYLKSGGRHGFVSTELPTAIVIAEGEADTFEKRVQAVVEAGEKRFKETQNAIAAINNGVPTRNILLKIPATPLGLEAGKKLEAQGYNVNYTLVATAEQYRATVIAHKEGVIEFVTRYAAAHENQAPPLELLPQSVSSDFVSRDDRNVAKLIDEKAFDKTLQLLISHVGAQRAIAVPDSSEANRLESIYEKLTRVQALPAEEINTNEEAADIRELFRTIRGTGPEGTTTAGLAFAQANIIDIWTSEFVNDEAWKTFLAKFFGAETSEAVGQINKILSQQIYWASTGVKVNNVYTTNPFYLAGLVVPNTTNTVPRDVVEALAKSETAPFEVQTVSEENKVAAREILETLRSLGIDLGLIKRNVIFPEGLKEFNGSDIASYDLLTDAIDIAKLVNKVFNGEAELLETNVPFANLPSRLEEILRSREISQVFVQGQQLTFPEAPGIPAPVAAALANPNAVAPVASGPNSQAITTTAAENPRNLPAQVTGPAATNLNLPEQRLSVPEQITAQPNPAAPADNLRITQSELPQTESRPIQPVAENAVPLLAPSQPSTVQAPDLTAAKAGPFTNPAVPQIVAPQIPAAVNPTAVDRIPLIAAEIIKIIPQINRSKNNEHEQLEFVLTFEPRNKLQVNFIRSEFRPRPEELRQEAGVDEAQDRSQEVRTRNEVRRYLKQANAIFAGVEFPVISDAAAVRREALRANTSNFDEGTIVDSHFAFDLGGLAAIPTLTGGKRPAVIILSDDAGIAAKQEAFVEGFNNHAGLKKNQRILVARSADEAVEKLRHRIKDPNVVLRAFVSSGGNGAETLKKQLEKARVSVSLLTMKGFDQMVPKGSRLAAFVTAIRDQFVAFSKAV